MKVPEPGTTALTTLTACALRQAQGCLEAGNGEPESKPHNTRILFLCNFLSKGWEVSILGLLAFIQQKYGLGIYMVGILSAVFLVSQISVSFFAGRIAHTIHSSNVIFLSIAASALAWMTLYFAGHVSPLFVAYMFGGISSGLFEPIGNSLVAKYSSSKNRGTAIGNFAAFGDMGRIAIVAAATALAGLLGINNACAVLFASAVAALVLAIIFIPKTNGTAHSVAGETPVHVRDLLKNNKFCYATAAGIADSFSSASLYIFIPFLLEAKGIKLANTLYYNVVFFAGYMSGRLVLGRLADRYGAADTLIRCNTVMALLVLLLTLVPSDQGRPLLAGAHQWVSSASAMTLILLFLLGIFTRGSSPIIRAMVADSMDERISFHNAFSAYSFASRSSSALSRPIYGFLASCAGIGAVFYVASAISLCTLYPAAKYKNQ